VTATSDTAANESQSSGALSAGEIDIARQMISQVVEGWSFSEPLLFAAWTRHQLVCDQNITNLRVGGGKIEWNPHFIRSLNQQQLNEVLRLEATRILLGHPYRRRRADAQKTFLASNLAVQECLRTTLPLPRPRDLFGSHRFDDQYFEYYYDHLNVEEDPAENQDQDQDRDKDKDKDKEQSGERAAESASGSGHDAAEPNSSEQSDPPAGNSLAKETDDESDEAVEDADDSGSDDPNEGQQDADQSAGEDASAGGDQSGEGSQQSAGNAAGQPTPLDQYLDSTRSGAENTAGWSDDPWMQEDLRGMVARAAESDGWGSIAGSTRQRLMAGLSWSFDPREVLRKFRRSVLSKRRRLTRMRPSRRYGSDQMGSRYDETTRLLLAVDVSGSMDLEAISRGFGVAKSLFRSPTESIDVVTFDTEIRSPIMPIRRTVRSIEIIGRGGTAFGPVLDLIDQHPAYDGLIIYTDGQAPVPSPPQRSHAKVLWLLHRQILDQRRIEAFRDIGEVVCLPSVRQNG